MGWKICVNPFNSHGNHLYKTRSISADFQLKCDAVLIKGQLTQGQQICDKCYCTIRHQYEQLICNETLSLNLQETMDMDVDGDDLHEEFSELSNFVCQRTTRSSTLISQTTQGSISVEDAQHAFNEFLRIFNIPPMISGLSNTQKNTVFKEKCLCVFEKMKEVVECLSPQASSVFMHEQCSDCKDLTDDIKKKISDHWKKRKISIGYMLAA